VLEHWLTGLLGEVALCLQALRESQHHPVTLLCEIAQDVKSGGHGRAWLIEQATVTHMLFRDTRIIDANIPVTVHVLEGFTAHAAELFPD